MEIIDKHYDALVKTNRKQMIVVDDDIVDYIFTIFQDDGSLTFSFKFTYFSNRFKIEEVMQRMFDAIDAKKSQLIYKTIFVIVEVIYEREVPRENLTVIGYPHVEFLLSCKENWFVSKKSFAMFGSIDVNVDLHVYKEGNLSEKPNYIKTFAATVESTDTLDIVQGKLRDQVLQKKTYYDDYIFGQFFLTDIFGKDIEIFEDNSVTISSAISETHYIKYYFCCQVVYDGTLLM